MKLKAFVILMSIVALTACGQNGSNGVGNGNQEQGGSPVPTGEVGIFSVKEGEANSSIVFGIWKGDSVSENGFEHQMRLRIDANKFTVGVRCLTENGDAVTAEVDSPAVILGDEIRILESHSKEARLQTRPVNLRCEAHTNPMTFHYRLLSGQLVISAGSDSLALSKVRD